MNALVDRLAGWGRLMVLAARLLAGRHFWIWPLPPVLWVGFQFATLHIPGWRQETNFDPVHAQGLLIGTPLVILAIGLGVRVMAGEIDQRTLEIAYTVPGGTHRVWLAKLTAAVMMLVASMATLSVATYYLCTDIPPWAFYGAMQAAIFYLVLSMGLSALTKSEATGALLTTGVLIFNWFIQLADLRISPFFNPLKLDDHDAADVLAWTVQNRIGFLLAIAVVTLLAFGRAERREKMLGG